MPRPSNLPQCIAIDFSTGGVYEMNPADMPAASAHIGETSGYCEPSPGSSTRRAFIEVYVQCYSAVELAEMRKAPTSQGDAT